MLVLFTGHKGLRGRSARPRGAVRLRDVSTILTKGDKSGEVTAGGSDVGFPGGELWERDWEPWKPRVI